MRDPRLDSLGEEVEHGTADLLAVLDLDGELAIDGFVAVEPSYGAARGERREGNGSR